MLLSLASGCVLDTRGAATVEVAAAAGWPATGLWMDWDDPATLRSTRSALDRTGVVALDVELVRLAPGPFKDSWRRVIALGGELGARNVLVISNDPDRAATTAAFREVCELAAAAGMRACLEFMAFTAVRTLADAVAVVGAADHPAGAVLVDTLPVGRGAPAGGGGGPPPPPAGAVLVDTLHLDRTGGSAAEIAALDPAWLPYAQWCDGPAEGPAMDDTEALVRDALDARSCPGEGGLDVGGFVAALPAGTPLSMEIRSAWYRDQFADPAERAAAILAATSRWLAGQPSGSG
jgi:sugar phosphate isomerase/epimerase